MRGAPYRIFPLGDHALTIEFGNEISDALNAKAQSLADWFESNPFPGFVEAFPAYSSITISYDTLKVRKAFGADAFETVRSFAIKGIDESHNLESGESRLFEIPISFGHDAALDLESIAGAKNLSREAVIEIFLSKVYRIYMIGFLPGFPYMGKVDERIAVPRKQSPRLRVPKGSVGIAGGQTGIYPMESPGGWQIVGRTNLEIFTPQDDPPCLLRPGDEVRFTRLG